MQELRKKLTLMEKSFKQQLSAERQKRLAANKRTEKAEEEVKRCEICLTCLILTCDLRLLIDVKQKEKLLQRGNIYAHRRMKGALSSGNIADFGKTVFETISKYSISFEESKHVKDTPAAQVTSKSRDIMADLVKMEEEKEAMNGKKPSKVKEGTIILEKAKDIEGKLHVM